MHDILPSEIQGSENRIIDLHRGKRELKSVEFWDDTQGFLNGKADVTLFGLKEHGPQGLRAGALCKKDVVT